MNYSSRKKNKIVKYIVIHYTGMKNLKLAYEKLTNNCSNVSTHYLISRNGIIFNLLCVKYKAWHAGVSKWKNNKNINEYSIGIELENRGHSLGYSNFTKLQYLSLKKLIIFLKNNFLIRNENIIFHSDISPNRKQDPGEKFFLKKIGINRFKNIKCPKNLINLNQMLKIYGFHNYYIKNHKGYCIAAAKRSLNYSRISSSISKKFMDDFYNLLFK